MEAAGDPHNGAETGMMTTIFSQAQVREDGLNGEPTNSSTAKVN
jgi:hypothetical protein